jgi:hypothetical protein
MEYPEIEIGRRHNEQGEPLVFVGGALCGTVETWKSMIAQYELKRPAKVFNPADPAFREAVLSVVRDATRRRAI